MEPQTQKKHFTFKPNDLSLEERHIARLHVFTPDGTEFEELIEPSAWAHVAHKLQPLARITVTSEPGHYTGELIVLACGHQSAKVHPLSYVDLRKITVENPEDSHTAAWVSNRYQWGVKRKSDGVWVEKDIQDQSTAMERAAKLSQEYKAVG